MIDHDLWMMIFNWYVPLPCQMIRGYPWVPHTAWLPRCRRRSVVPYWVWTPRGCCESQARPGQQPSPFLRSFGRLPRDKPLWKMMQDAISKLFDAFSCYKIPWDTTSHTLTHRRTIYILIPNILLWFSERSSDHSTGKSWANHIPNVVHAMRCLVSDCPSNNILNILKPPL